MYKIREKVYADAGCIIKGNNARGYILRGELSDFVEERVEIDDMRVEGRFLYYSNDTIREIYHPQYTYEQLKTHIVKRLFSNDDQIAIILNKDKSAEDLAIFNKMQEWRDWAGTLAKKIIETGKKFDTD